MTITTAHSLWLLPFCVLLGVLFAWWMYRKGTERFGWNKGLNLLLSVLRAALVAAMAFFLLEPMVRLMVREVRKPVIVVAHDGSTSLLLAGDTALIRNAYADRLQALVDKLSEEHEVRTFTYGDAVQEGIDLSQQGQQTDIAQLLREVYDRFSGPDLGAVILDGDGIINRGRDPRQEAERLGVPVYTIALGDTTVKPDLLLKAVEHNRISYLGNEFPVLARIAAGHLRGERSRVTILFEGKEVAAKDLTIDSDPFFVEVPLLVKAEKPGLQRYTVVLRAVQGEVSDANNRQDIFVDVLDDRRKVLLLGAAPHPDLGAVRNALNGLEGYGTEVAMVTGPEVKVEDFDLVVLHGLPSSQYPVDPLIQRCAARKIPLLVIVGERSDLTRVSKLGAGIEVVGGQRAVTDAQAAYNKDFALFELSPDDARAFERFPPLQVPFGQYALGRSAQALFMQRVGVVRTAYPMIALQGQQEQRMAVICGEGLWRWRIADQQLYGTHEHFDGLVHKLVQFLALHADKSRFRVRSANLFAENEPVVIEAELYNASYEAINTPDAEVVLRDEEGKEYPYAFSPRQNAYRLEAAALPPGRYTYRASVQHDGERLVANGELSVRELVMEQMTTVADHALLADLAVRTGGVMVDPNDLDPVVAAIDGRTEIVPRSFAQATFTDLVGMRWIFFALLALLTLEWVLRRRNGAY